jgi:spore maturation protein CgeB
LKVLFIQPGASYATADVYNGIVAALGRRHDVELYQYVLDQRIAASAAWLHYILKRKRKVDPSFPKPGPGDVIYHASQDALIRALKIEADWVVIVSGMYFHPDMMTLMQRAGLKIALLLTESPYDDVNQAGIVQRADLVWTNERTSLPFLRQYNPSTFYLPHAYDETLHNAYASPREDVPAHDVVFVGTGFQERADILNAVNWDGIDLGLYGEWTLLGSRSKLRKSLKSGPVPNEVAVALYKRAKIGLNLYRESVGFGPHQARITDAESLNPRALELAACGVFTISNMRPEVRETFGDLVPAFRDAPQLETLIRHYLASDRERARIAAALPQAVSEGWTFDDRAEQLVRDLCQHSAIGPRSLQALSA